MTATQDTIRVYKRVTGSVWQRMTPTFGIRTINAIAKNAIARSGRTHPDLTYLVVSAEDGLTWERLEQHVVAMDDEEVSTMLADFLDEFFDGLSTLTGQLIADKIFKDAEHEVTAGDAAERKDK